MKSLDRTDFEIVMQLRKNARISNKELAHKINMAPSSCLIRVRNLQSKGVLKGFHAELDPTSLGFGIQAMIAVRLGRHFKPDVDAFHAHTLGLPEVIQLYHVSGANDFLVHVWVRDAEHLRELTMTAITGREEVAHIETSLIFEHSRSLDLPERGELDQDSGGER
jgi:DNA-binding Lrp family transcriptional regulator